MDKKKIKGIVATGIVSAGMLNQIPMTSLAATRREVNDGLKVTESLQQDNKKIIVHMPDENLRRVLNEKYLHQAPDAQITRYQLRNLIGTLYLGNSHIKDLTGIEECKGITGLYLSYNNEITDLTPIKNMKNLKRLNVTDQTITVDANKFSENMIKDIDGKTVTLTKTSDNTYKFNKMIRYGNKDYETYFSGTITVKDSEGKIPSTSTTQVQGTKPSTSPIKGEDKKPNTSTTTGVNTKPSTSNATGENKKPSISTTTEVNKKPSTPPTKGEDKNQNTPTTEGQATKPSTSTTTGVNTKPSTSTTTEVNKKPSTSPTKGEDKNQITSTTTGVNTKPSTSTTTETNKKPSTPSTTVANKVVVNIPDTNLKKALNTELGQKADKDITKEQLLGLTGTLYLGDSEIKDLTGIQECQNITGLYLGMNRITDLTPLKTLPKLTYLDVIEQNIVLDQSKFSEDLVKNVNGETVKLDKLGDNTYSFFTEVTNADGKYIGQFSGTITVENVKPVEPVKPTEPEQPITPSNPVVPEKPVDPVKPTDQENQITPVEPSTPVVSEKPAEPTKPTEPEKTEKPTEPSNQVESQKPTKPSITENDELNVYIPDENLRIALNTKYLNQAPDAKITKEQLRSLTGDLYLGYSDIKDLTGIQECKNITGLYLSYGNSIKDLTPLKSLTNLRGLDVMEQKIIVSQSEFRKDMVKDINGETVELNEISPNMYTFFKEVSYGNSGYTGYFSGKIIIN